MPTGLTDKLLKVFRDILDETVCHGNMGELKERPDLADLRLKADCYFHFSKVISRKSARFV